MTHFDDNSPSSPDRPDLPPLPKGRLLALDVAVSAAAQVTRLVQHVPAALKSQQDQAIRAAARVALAIAEGQGRLGRGGGPMTRPATGDAPVTRPCAPARAAALAAEIRNRHPAPLFSRPSGDFSSPTRSLCR